MFASGFGLAAVEAVCAGGAVEDHDVLGLLTSLVNKSLVQVDRSCRPLPASRDNASVRQHCPGSRRRDRGGPGSSPRPPHHAGRNPCNRWVRPASSCSALGGPRSLTWRGQLALRPRPGACPSSSTLAPTCSERCGSPSSTVLRLVVLRLGLAASGGAGGRAGTPRRADLLYFALRSANAQLGPTTTSLRLRMGADRTRPVGRV